MNDVSKIKSFLLASLFKQIEPEDDYTAILKTLAVVSLFGCALILIVACINIFLPARAAERQKIAVHNEQTFEKLRAKHGEKATAAVVYEKDGEAYYYKDGKKIKFQ